MTCNILKKMARHDAIIDAVRLNARKLMDAQFLAAFI